MRATRTGGRVGLPCTTVGRSVLVRRSAIRPLLHSATIHDPDDQIA